MTGARRSRTPSKLPTRQLSRGTLLYYGTSAVEQFTMPRGPAWFTFTLEKAHHWSHWAPVGGTPRVLSFAVKQGVTLFDTRSLRNWRRLAEHLGVEDTTYPMSRAVCKIGDGWYGRDEILLCAPRRHLTPVSSFRREIDETPGRKRRGRGG